MIHSPNAGGLSLFSWTHPTSYRTAREEDRLGFLGEAIRAYKLNDYTGCRGRLRL
jgi:hypothetical protein